MKFGLNSPGYILEPGCMEYSLIRAVAFIGDRTLDEDDGILLLTFYADDPDWASEILETEGPNDYTRKAFIEAWNWAKEHLPEYKDYPDYK